MEKGYADQLGNWVKENPSTLRARNLTAFLEVREDVRVALAAGYPMKTIWANMHQAKRLPFGYDAFLHYVHRYLDDGEKAQPAGRLRPAPPQNHPTPVKPIEASAKTSPSGFTFNPAPNKEELL